MHIRRHDSGCIKPCRNKAAVSFIKLGSEHLCRDDFTCASASFEAALLILEFPLNSHSSSFAAEYFEKENQILQSKNMHTSDIPTELTICQPDIYEEDECDVGPRIMREPIIPDSASENDGPLLEAIILFNKGLLYHKMGNFLLARKLFETSAFTTQTMLGFTLGTPSTTFLRLAMCAHNNLGLLSYLECKEGVAAASFEAAAQFGKHLVSTCDKYKLEYANAVSNWCRVNWMRGDVGESLHFPLEEILRIRSEALTWDHIDVAAAHYNVAVAEYSRQNSKKAVIHINHYLTIAKHRADFGLNDLNSVPALIYQLLIENEDKNDSPSQELVRGLRALQEKRQEYGPNSLEVACILNYVGTLLFHQQDFERAMIFFLEELRLEDATERVRIECLDVDKLCETTSITVTCNNIGRILQELGKYQEAISYYYRALQPVYGDVSAHLHNPDKECSVFTSLTVRFPSSANLYSTVWYNLGLIHDKLESYNEAINAFKISLQLRTALLGNNHSDIACLLYNIGVLQMEQQRLNDASVSFREALNIRRVTSPGRLSDRHVIKTLVKLAALHRDSGNVHGAMDIAKEIFTIQVVTSEYDEITRMKEVGATLRFTGELHHSIGDLHAAITLSIDSVSKLRIAADLSAKQQSQNLDPCVDSILIKDRIANIEQFVLTLLLLGSLYHEVGDPLKATTVLNEAAIIVQGTVTSSTLCPAIAIPSTLFALQEVTAMLGTFQCAPMA
jgi:tetratricopeptide (TPR) repeat protein